MQPCCGTREVASSSPSMSPGLNRSSIFPWVPEPVPCRLRFSPVALSLVALSLVALMSLCASAFAGGDAKLFRWVDENGVVHYTDQIPPAQVDKGHSELSDKGVRVGVVPPAQSVEEIQRERELERLRAQQDRLVEQQKAADRVLLRTYRSVDDLVMAREGKIAAIDVVINVSRGNIRRQQDWLRNLRAEAADLERAGKPVPAHVTEAIAKSERYIRESYATIVNREQQKEMILADFDRDLRRFRQLKDIPEDKTDAVPERPRLALRNLVNCDNTAQCDQYWARAVAYAQAHATTPIQTSGANILITAPPEKQDDLGLTLSRIQEKEGAVTTIFLDLQCKNQSAADVGCADARALKVLSEFRDVVTAPAALPEIPTGAPAQSETARPRQVPSSRVE